MSGVGSGFSTKEIRLDFGLVTQTCPIAIPNYIVCLTHPGKYNTCRHLY